MKLTKEQQRLAEQLNPKQLKFANLYLNGMSATQAFKQAGYQRRTEMSYESGASQLVKKSKVSAYLHGMQQAMQADTLKRVKLNLHEIIERIKYHAGMTDQAPFDSSASSQIKATSLLLDCIERYPVETGFELPPGTPLERIDYIIDGMANGTISVYLGNSLIKSLQIRIDVEEKTEVVKKLEELEAKLKNNSKLQLPSTFPAVYSQAA